MSKLISRDKQIPNGFKFYQPEIRWRSQPYQSFHRIVEAVVKARAANPRLLQANHWSLDYDTVALEVEEFNVRICEQMGWTDFITGGAGGAGNSPKSLLPYRTRQHSQNETNAAAGSVKKIWAGVRTINDWLNSDEAAVSTEKAEARAKVCAACPQNTPGDFTRWFTIPASEAIRRQLEKAASRNLATSLDANLNLCGVCLCPLKLSVHVPLHLKLAHLSPEVEFELRHVKPACWVTAEKDGK